MAGNTLVMKWPKMAVPVVRSGGTFPMKARNQGLVYRSAATMAIHLHNYAGTLWLGGKAVALQPGDFTLTPAGLSSHYDLDAPGYHLCMHVETLPAGRAALTLPLHWRTGSQARRVQERMQDVIQLYRTHLEAGADAGLAKLAAGAALQSLLIWVALIAARRQPLRVHPAGRVEGAMERVRRYLDDHYRESIRVPLLAKNAGVSQNYLARRFREEQGMTLQRYLLGRRIDLARHLLAFTDMPVKAVAIDAGLGNPQYFHRQFVRAVGHSPSRERELAGTRQA